MLTTSEEDSRLWKLSMKMPYDKSMPGIFEEEQEQGRAMRKSREEVGWREQGEQ